MKSIIQQGKYCYETGMVVNLDKHHIFFSANRKNSETYGLWVYLHHSYHIADSPNKTPHNDRKTDLKYKRLAQVAFEEKVGSREDFLKIFGRNYL